MVVFRGATCYVILNLYPYNNGHLMIVPKRHIDSLAAASADERGELMELARCAELALGEAYHPHGMNMGINLGRRAEPASSITCTCMSCRAGRATRTS